MAQNSESAPSPYDARIARILSVLPDRSAEPSVRNLKRLAYAIGEGGVVRVVDVDDVDLPDDAIQSMSTEPDDSEDSRRKITRGVARIKDVVERHRAELCKLRDHPAFAKGDVRTIVGLIAAIIDIVVGGGTAALAVAIYFYGLDNVCAGKTPVLP